MLTAVVALIWSLSVEIILDLPGDLAVQGLIFMLTFIFYNRDRLTASPSLDDEINMGDRTRWIARYQRGLKGVVRAAIVCAAVLLVVRPDAILPIMLGLGFALLYSVRCLPSGLAPKQLPGLKAPYVAMLWSLLVVGIPNAVEGEGWNEPVYMTMGFVFFYSVAVITVNDIRDIVGDQVASTRSLAVILGERWAHALCIGCVSLAACIGLALDSIGLVVAAGLLGLTVVTYRREINDLFSWNFSIIVLITWIVVLFLG